MRLIDIPAILKDRRGSEINLIDKTIMGIELDSRNVQAGYLFVAIQGTNSDGHQFIDEAIQNGVIAVVGEMDLEKELPIPYFQVKDSRVALGQLAAFFYQYPSGKHKVIGVTGTNGKTTTSYLIRHILQSVGRTCSLIGTVSNIINNKTITSSNTTPDAIQLQRLLFESNDEFVIIEVSSHALNQSRTEGIRLDFALFTNLSHDHLDYHHNMNDYYYEKKKIFKLLKDEGESIINVDNEWGKLLARELDESIPQSLVGSDGEYLIGNIQMNGQTSFTVQHLGKNYKILLPLQGIHNINNAAMAFVTSLRIGLKPEQIRAALARFSGVPGRFESVFNEHGARFVVDYAHTKDAFEYCLQTAKYQKANNIYHIFGFRGGRDRSKREDMIRVSAKYSDLFILTMDDLNEESKEDMLEDLRAFHGSFPNGQVIPDRTLAIQTLWEIAEEGDWIFITGKGPERYKSHFQLGTDCDIDTLNYLKGSNDETHK
ncbi:UDP-N-acetylmuramoyl-L-alanyl-D-glutamate--2,6-diaminopimelate ligase [Cytobacillus purgationiresistens]|uniref:UDP-N-acetylmuramyl-tripeptide synthetase n=1 Tax=Cytobacillus purgationiresistens TaxID=863449 RepID=A0ABU0AJ00_9BACI|nr:UDP-N-acetylmuramoyl-L-alanyl-D-glutamate--2,6-diaminopimelate ligase [Cytobacillus purgationiresistens]MDQ0270844.1 UDP-N-acetylmuramoyl-L-alanyl-D-glutamate--2,6-diaminopimelate ligase [Cytobacillus purgationiresistens]